MIRDCELCKASIFDFVDDDAGATTIIVTNIAIGTEAYEPVSAVAAAIRYWEKYLDEVEEAALTARKLTRLPRSLR
ncbi:hypothetical protein [Rhizobium sp. AN5]|uniref:hypothetical protein n=1 Tax=Rhizobium sp. AN5 TaxID=1855304 RepID=UPI000BE30C98|nr:hypothetical protein [Rhizobium sp. AN5]